jgi:hypothetical protein
VPDAAVILDHHLVRVRRDPAEDLRGVRSSGLREQETVRSSEQLGRTVAL